MIAHDQDGVVLHHGDCIDVLATLPDASVDAVVTDPPYALDFMGHGWDRYTPVEFQHWCEQWAAECLRVLKPGGHMLAFGGTRTFHRLAAGIEDAGFEIRDVLTWLYGSGFPKSMDVAQAIDKLDAADERLARAREFQGWLRLHLTPQRVNALTGTDMGHHLTTHPSQPAIATAELFDALRSELPEVPQRIEDLVAQRTVESMNFAARPVVGQHRASVLRGTAGVTAGGEGKARTSAATSEAKSWDGWGTALKPAWEPIVLARKPLAGTVAATVLEHGTGALNIDACRLPMSDSDVAAVNAKHAGMDLAAYQRAAGVSLNLSVNPMALKAAQAHELGRFPANVVLDEAAAAALDEQSGTSRSRAGKPRAAAAGPGWGMTRTGAEYDDEGGASRFFYSAKADAAERPVVDGVAHPTVKPLALMEWLITLVTPPGGMVLEPFAGSGTTLEAAQYTGHPAVGIEKGEEYLPLIIHRLQRTDPRVKRPKPVEVHPDQLDLLEGLAS